MPAHRDVELPSHLGTFVLALPFASAISAAVVALAVGADLGEAVFAGSMSGAFPAFASAALTSSRRPSAGRKAALYACGALATLLLAACYVYGRLAGYPTTDIRAGLSVVLLALMTAALATAFLNMARTRSGLPAERTRAR